MKDLKFEEIDFNEVIENTQNNLKEVSPYFTIKEFEDKFNLR